jgi:hypothetical protein
MPSTVNDADTLKVCLGPDGSVWAASGCSAPARMAANLHQFRDSVAPRYACFRFPGHAVYASTLCFLSSRKLAGEVMSLQVCSPALCVRAQEGHVPEAMLLRMRSLQDAPSRGGWHEFVQEDYVSYAMAACLRKTDAEPAAPMTALLFLRQHPIYPLLTFFPYSSFDHACRLVAAVLDPRFYVDSDAPDEQFKLERYLGVHVATIERVLSYRAGKRPLPESPGRPHRCEAMLGSWDWSRRDGEHRPSAYFLQQLSARHSDDAIGKTQASRIFLKLLRYYWLEKLCYSQAPGSLFVPEHLVESATVARAITDHLCKFQSM